MENIVAQDVDSLCRARLIICPHGVTAFLYNLFVLPVNDHTTTLCSSLGYVLQGYGRRKLIQTAGQFHQQGIANRGIINAEISESLNHFRLISQLLRCSMA